MTETQLRERTERARWLLAEDLKGFMASEGPAAQLAWVLGELSCAQCEALRERLTEWIAEWRRRQG